MAVGYSLAAIEDYFDGLVVSGSMEALFAVFAYLLDFSLNLHMQQHLMKSNAWLNAEREQLNQHYANRPLMYAHR
jgi:hypothetical protein